MSWAVLILLFLIAYAENNPLLFWVFYAMWGIGIVFYFAIQESSDFQATVGKRALNIKVVDKRGNKISFWRALGRYLAKIISALILYIGFIMIGFTSKKQGLHDIIADTLVIAND